MIRFDGGGDAAPARSWLALGRGNGEGFHANAIASDLLVNVVERRTHASLRKTLREAPSDVGRAVAAGGGGEGWLALGGGTGVGVFVDGFGPSEVDLWQWEVKDRQWEAKDGQWEVNEDRQWEVKDRQWTGSGQAVDRHRTVHRAVDRQRTGSGHAADRPRPASAMRLARCRARRRCRPRTATNGGALATWLLVPRRKHKAEAVS